MGFVPIPNTASVELIFEALGQKVENVYHVKGVAPLSEPNLATICEAFVDWFTTDGSSRIYSGINLVKIVAKDLTTASGPAIEFINGLPINGAAATGTPLPLNVTAAISFGTALRGRSYRGRVYHVGLMSNMISGNSLTSESRVGLISDYAALISAVSTAGYTLCVASRVVNKAPRNTGIATPVNSVNVNTDLDSQRRRLNSRGQ